MSTLTDFNEHAHQRLGVAGVAVAKRGGPARFRKLADEGDAAITAGGQDAVAERAMAHLHIAGCLAVAAEGTNDPESSWDDAVRAIDHVDQAVALVADAPPFVRTRVLARAAAMMAPWERLANVDLSERLPDLAREVGAAMTTQHELREKGIRDLTTARQLLRLADAHPDRRDRLRAAATEEARAALQALAEAGESHLASQARHTLAVAGG